MAPFSNDEGVLAPINDSVFLEIENNDLLSRPASLCSRRRNSSSSSTSSAVSVEHFPISPIPERSVSFFPYGEVIEIETLDEYTDEEMDACWYNDEEIIAIRRSVQDTVRRITRGSRHPDDCPRGLESQMQSFYSSSRRIRFDSITAVLSEQYKQRNQTGGKKEDPERIREVYTSVAKLCLGKSIENARYDAWEAYRVHQEANTPAKRVDRETNKLCWFFDISTWFPRVTVSPVIDAVDC